MARSGHPSQASVPTRYGIFSKRFWSAVMGDSRIMPNLALGRRSRPARSGCPRLRDQPIVKGCLHRGESTRPLTYHRRPAPPLEMAAKISVITTGFKVFSCNRRRPASSPITGVLVGVSRRPRRCCESHSVAVAPPYILTRRGPLRLTTSAYPD